MIEALAQFRDAKQRFNRAVIAFLEGKPDAASEVDDALREVEEAIESVRAAMGEA